MVNYGGLYEIWQDMRRRKACERFVSSIAPGKRGIASEALRRPLLRPSLHKFSGKLDNGIGLANIYCTPFLCVCVSIYVKP